MPKFIVPGFTSSALSPPEPVYVLEDRRVIDPAYRPRNPQSTQPPILPYQDGKRRVYDHSYCPFPLLDAKRASPRERAVYFNTFKHSELEPLPGLHEVKLAQGHRGGAPAKFPRSTQDLNPFISPSPTSLGKLSTEGAQQEDVSYTDVPNVTVVPPGEDEPVLLDKGSRHSGKSKL